MPHRGITLRLLRFHITCPRNALLVEVNPSGPQVLLNTYCPLCRRDRGPPTSICLTEPNRGRPLTPPQFAAAPPPIAPPPALPPGPGSRTSRRAVPPRATLPPPGASGAPENRSAVRSPAGPTTPRPDM